MRDDEVPPLAELAERRLGSGDDPFVGFEVVRAPACLEPAGPVAFDVGDPPSLPRTRVGFAPAGIGRGSREREPLGDDRGGLHCATEVARGHTIERRQRCQSRGGVLGLRPAVVGQRRVE